MNTPIPSCDCCRRAARYRFARAEAEPTLRCWRHAVFYAPVRRRALEVAAVVGSLLFLINQLDVVLSGHVTPLVVVKIVLTFLVPFVVSTYSALEINRLRAAKPTQMRPPFVTPGAAA